MHFEVALAHHGEEDGEVVEVGEDLPDHRLQLDAERNKTESQRSGRKEEEEWISFKGTG